MNSYVIIGNGTAAAACIEGIRSVDAAGSITVVSAEQHHVYGRPLISYYLEGKTDRERMLYRDADFYEANSCTVLYGKTAEAVDPAEKTVRLCDGTLLPYTALCIAAGAAPTHPALPGLETVPQKFSFYTLDDAEALKQAVTADSRVLILGAGLIGLKCAEGLRAITEHITVCNRSAQILTSILDAESAAPIQKRMEESGIRFLLSETVDHFEGASAVMAGGSTETFDILVLALGIRPNTELVTSIGGEVGRGIYVDGQMQTSIGGIYAAGDCTEGMDASLGSRSVLALLPNAYAQGFCAGVNMAGGEKRFENAIPMNSVGFFGLHLMTAGTRFPADQGGEVYETVTDGSIRKLYCRDGLLTGFILVGDTQRAGIYTAMIRDRLPIDSVNFELLKKTPTSTAYSSDTRRKMFGGVV